MSRQADDRGWAGVMVRLAERKAAEAMRERAAKAVRAEIAKYPSPGPLVTNQHRALAIACKAIRALPLEEKDGE